MQEEKFGGLVQPNVSKSFIVVFDDKYYYEGENIDNTYSTININKASRMTKERADEIVAGFKRQGNAKTMNV